MSRPTVLMPVPMHDVVVEGCEDRFELLRLWEAADPDALLAERGADVRGLAVGGHRRIDATLFDQLPNLQIVANFGVGYDSVDVDAAGERGLTVTGRKLGILGLGRIGEAIARRAEPFGMTVGYHNRSEKDVPYRYYPSLLEMARDVDTLMVGVPGNAATRHLVDAEVLEALGRDGVLVNIGRGTVVDEAALIGALKTRTIRAAGLDVYEDEPNVPQELIDLDN